MSVADRVAQTLTTLADNGYSAAFLTERHM